MIRRDLEPFQTWPAIGEWNNRWYKAINTPNTNNNRSYRSYERDPVPFQMQSVIGKRTNRWYKTDNSPPLISIEAAVHSYVKIEVWKSYRVTWFSYNSQILSRYDAYEFKPFSLSSTWSWINVIDVPVIAVSEARSQHKTHWRTGMPLNTKLEDSVVKESQMQQWLFSFLNWLDYGMTSKCTISATFRENSERRFRRLRSTLQCLDYWTTWPAFAKNAGQPKSRLHWKPSGLFLESPENFSSPKSHS